MTKTKSRVCSTILLVLASPLVVACSKEADDSVSLEQPLAAPAESCTHVDSNAASSDCSAPPTNECAMLAAAESSGDWSDIWGIGKAAADVLNTCKSSFTGQPTAQERQDLESEAAQVARQMALGARYADLAATAAKNACTLPDPTQNVPTPTLCLQMYEVRTKDLMARTDGFCASVRAAVDKLLIDCVPGAAIPQWLNNLGNAPQNQQFLDVGRQRTENINMLRACLDKAEGVINDYTPRVAKVCNVIKKCSCTFSCSRLSVPVGGVTFDYTPLDQTRCLYSTDSETAAQTECAKLTGESPRLFSTNANVGACTYSEVPGFAK
jgi:hypothetical protein